MNLGEIIKKYRLENNLTRKDLATTLGFTEVTITRYENNTRRPNWDTVQKISKILNIPPDAILVDFIHYKDLKEISNFTESSDFYKELIMNYIKFVYNQDLDKADDEYALTPEELNHIFKESVRYISLLILQIKMNKDRYRVDMAVDKLEEERNRPL